MLAPIQLIDFAVDQLDYEQVRPPGEELPDALSGVVLGIDVEQVSGIDTEHPYVQLIISFNEEEVPEEAKASGHPYHQGRIVLSGWFNWSREKVAERVDNPEKLLLVNGLSMLYGIARQQLLQITEPGPAPRLMLPSISFLPFVERWLAKDEEEER